MNRSLRSGQGAEDATMIPSKFGPLGNPSEEPDCRGKRTTCRSKKWPSHQQRGNCDLLPQCFLGHKRLARIFLFNMVEVVSEEDDLFSSDEKGEHNVEHIMLCSFAHHACSRLVQGFLYKEELCKVALTCHFTLDLIFLCQC